MSYFEIYIAGWILWTVAWHFTEDKDTGLIMLSGLFYFFQIAAHIALGIRSLLGIPTDAIFYYDAITYVAWAQLLALGAWSGGIWILVHRPGHSGDALHRRAGHFHLRGKK